MTHSTQSKSYILSLQLYCNKDYKSELAKRRNTKGEGWESCKCEVSVVLRAHQASQHSKEYYQPGKLSQASVSEFFGFVSLCRHDWVNHYPTWLNHLQPSFLSQKSDWYHGGAKLQPFNHMVRLYSMVSLQPESSISLAKTI